MDGLAGFVWGKKGEVDCIGFLAAAAAQIVTAAVFWVAPGAQNGIGKMGHIWGKKMTTMRMGMNSRRASIHSQGEFTFWKSKLRKQISPPKMVVLQCSAFQEFGICVESAPAWISLPHREFCTLNIQPSFAHFGFGCVK